MSSPLSVASFFHFASFPWRLISLRVAVVACHSFDLLGVIIGVMFVRFSARLFRFVEAGGGCSIRTCCQKSRGFCLSSRHALQREQNGHLYLRSFSRLSSDRQLSPSSSSAYGFSSSVLGSNVKSRISRSWEGSLSQRPCASSSKLRPFPSNFALRYCRILCNSPLFLCPLVLGFAVPEPTYRWALERMRWLPMLSTS
ncbi:hypothetical protein F4819DRAFT_372273 [Hypoxylon fuscum]|nr:hypothetical protein F4819DRAFT_372273 [Hypoxylon fuscum]